MNDGLQTHHAAAEEPAMHGYHDWQATEFTLIATTLRQLDTCSVCGVLRLRPVPLSPPSDSAE